MARIEGFGNLGGNPELKYVGDEKDKAVCEFRFYLKSDRRKGEDECDSHVLTLRSTAAHTLRGAVPSSARQGVGPKVPHVRGRAKNKLDQPAGKPLPTDTSMSPTQNFTKQNP